jgi:hypothetical protein
MYAHMLQNLFIVSLIVFLSCSGRSTQKDSPPLVQTSVHSDTGYVWTKLLDSADWKKSYNFQMFTIRDTMWVFHPDGNWFSTDGVGWKKSILTNSINNLAFLDYVIFNGSVYGLGYFDGNIETFTFRPEIHITTDMKRWSTLKSNLPPRFFYHPFVFDNKIWIIGGEDKERKYADIWNSSDGTNWIKQKDDLPFGKRSGSQVVQMDGKLYLLDNDVWISTDALNWKKLTDEIVKGEQIFGYSAQIMDNKIWLLGCNRNGQFTSQVLVSSDGKNWVGMDAPWSPRGGIAATVFHGKIYMTGGKYGGTPNHPDFRYSNDVWVLETKN